MSRFRTSRDAAPERGRWWDRRTLRFRVVASLLAVMIAAFAVIGVVTVIDLTAALLGVLVVLPAALIAVEKR